MSRLLLVGLVALSVGLGGCVSSKGGSSKSQACDPTVDTKRCAGSFAIQVCDPDSSKWETVETCAPGTECTEAGGIPVCSASAPPVESCESNAHCVDGTSCYFHTLPSPWLPCVEGACVPNHCFDAAKSGDETYIDCGGSCLNGCANELPCLDAGDCESECCQQNGLCGSSDECATSLPGTGTITVDLLSPEGTFLHLTVEANGETLVEPKKSIFNSGVGSVSLFGIPFGDARQVVIEGWNESQNGDLGVLLSRGRSAPVDVKSWDSSVNVEVMLAPVNSFIPPTSKLDSTVQSLSQGRVGHTVTKTPKGEILVVGGGTLSSETSAWWNPAAQEASFATYYNSVEVYDEAMRHISLHPNGMYFGRVWHSATALPTGQVFLAGGYTNLGGTAQALKRVEVYHPGLTNPIDVIKFDMQVPRWGHTATLVDEESFTLLFVGGDAAGSAQGTYELWDPYVGTIAFGELPDNSLRRHHQSTLFEVPDYGPAVLISGGESATSTLDTMLVYDVKKNIMMVHSGKLSAPRAQHAAVWVPGRDFIYLAGGFTNKTRTAVSNAIDVYDTGKDTVQAMPGFNLKTSRGGHAAAKAFGNSVVFSGGTGSGGTMLDSIEVIYEYLDCEAGSYRIEVAESSGIPGGIPSLPVTRTGHRSVFTDSGMILTIGGVSAGAILPTDVLLYNPR